MIKIRPILLGLVVSLLLSSVIGCGYFPEATFTLANESRLPKWLTLPPGLTRSDVSVTMSYYVMPWGPTAKVTLRDTKKQTIAEENGKAKCTHPFQLKNPPQGFPPGYPAYEAITVNGITEMIEHRKMEPMFYVTDDATVANQFSCK